MFPAYQSNVKQVFDSHLWGMTHVISHVHYKYFVTFLNDYSCLTQVYFLSSKDEVFSAFKFFSCLCSNPIYFTN